MKPFWRKEPLSTEETRLCMLVARAHHESVFRSNLSSVAVQQAAVGSGDYIKAIAAGLMTLGGPHGPIVQTTVLLSLPSPLNEACHILDGGRRVPGWGNSFAKGVPDPLWKSVDSCLAEHFKPMAQTLDGITGALHARKKMVYPNPSAYTAALANIIGMPAAISPYLLILFRLPGWTELILDGPRVLS